MAKADKIKTGLLVRTFEIERAKLNNEKRTVELSFASEIPVQRWFGWEILDCKPESVDLSRLNNGGALLVEHDPSDQVGVVESARCDDDKKTRAVVRFGSSARASEIFEDVRDNIRRLVSVGYRIQKMVTEKIEGDVETMRATLWTPMELSIVAVPADPTVGIGRSGNTGEFETVIERKINMDDEKKVQDPPSTKAETLPEAEVRRQERERCREIQAIVDKRQTETCRTMAKKYIAEGKSLDDFRAWVLENEFQAKPVDTKPELGMNDKEIKRYSLMNAIRSVLKPHGGLEGIEKECHEAMCKKLRKDPDGAGTAMAFYIPYDVESRHLFKMEDEENDYRRLNNTLTRALTAGSFSGGAATISTDLGSMIEMVRNNMEVVNIGARVLGGLVGDLAIPRQTGGATAYWLAETADVTASTQAFDQLLLTPHRLSAATAYTNQFLQQTSLDCEAFVRGDLAQVIALEKDETALNGSGVAGEPQGLRGTTGVTSVTIASAAAITYIECVSFDTALATNNLLRGSLGWLMTALRRSHGLTTFYNASYGDVPLWIGGQVGTFCGYPARQTQQLTATYPIIFGNWADLLIADWAGTSILVDPYSLSLSNQIRIVVQILTDVGVRHPLSFAYGSQ